MDRFLKPLRFSDVQKPYLKRIKTEGWFEKKSNSTNQIELVAKVEPTAAGMQVLRQRILKCNENLTDSSLKIGQHAYKLPFLGRKQSIKTR